MASLDAARPTETRLVMDATPDVTFRTFNYTR